MARAGGWMRQTGLEEKIGTDRIYAEIDEGTRSK